MLWVVWTLAGCKTASKVDYDRPMPEIADEELIGLLSEHNNEFEWYATKGSIDADVEEGGFSGSIYLRMKADSASWILVKKLGIEFLRISANRDVVHVINRLERDYYTLGIQEVYRHLPVRLTYLDMQYFLTGNVFLPTADYKVSKSGRYYLISFDDNGTHIEHSINGYTGKLERSAYTVGDQSITIEYSDYKQVEGAGEIAHEKKITRFNAGVEIESVNFSAKEISINEKVKMPFKIPDR